MKKYIKQCQYKDSAFENPEWHTAKARQAHLYLLYRSHLDRVCNRGGLDFFLVEYFSNFLLWLSEDPEVGHNHPRANSPTPLFVIAEFVIILL